MKILKSKRGLSPVVASIILIAVTVAVSIAVAAWMGALTIGFMGSSSVTVQDYTFNSDGTISMWLKNSGTKQITINQVKVNDAVADFDGPTLVAIDANNVPLTITYAWVAGQSYKIDFLDNSAQIVGSYQAKAP